jgi:hypothetical protein
MVLIKYPAWTIPPSPELAAQTKAPVKSAAGIAYRYEYSGGSVGRRNRSSIRFVMRKPPKMSGLSAADLFTSRSVESSLRLARNTLAAPRN